MGVTIHYRGKLKDRAAYAQTIARAKEFAQARGWMHREIPEEYRRLDRMRGDEEWRYEGSTQGIELLPHADCEPVRLEFDRDLCIQDYTKTQFAPPDVHIDVVALLRALAPCFARLEVEDEGEYFETGDRARLVAHIDACNAMIEALKRSDPRSSSGVRLPSGRMLDVYG